MSPQRIIEGVGKFLGATCFTTKENYNFFHGTYRLSDGTHSEFWIVLFFPRCYVISYRLSLEIKFLDTWGVFWISCPGVKFDYTCLLQSRINAPCALKHPVSFWFWLPSQFIPTACLIISFSPRQWIWWDRNPF